jgi:hypothetical protein
VVDLFTIRDGERGNTRGIHSIGKNTITHGLNPHTNMKIQGSNATKERYRVEVLPNPKERGLEDPRDPSH